MTQELFAILDHETSVSFKPPSKAAVLTEDVQDQLRVEVRHHLMESARLKEEIDQQGVEMIVTAAGMIARAGAERQGILR